MLSTNGDFTNVALICALIEYNTQILFRSDRGDGKNEKGSIAVTMAGENALDTLVSVRPGRRTKIGLKKGDMAHGAGPSTLVSFRSGHDRTEKRTKADAETKTNSAPLFQSGRTPGTCQTEKSTRGALGTEVSPAHSFQFDTTPVKSN